MSEEKRHTVNRAVAPIDPLDALVGCEPAAEIALGNRGARKQLERLRSRGLGPPFYKLNERTVRYRVRDLLAWREKFRVDAAVATVD